MPSRDRSSVATRYEGIWQRFGTTFGGGQCFSALNSCSDIIGPGDNAPLTVHHVDFSGGRINRPVVGFFTAQFTDFVADVLKNSAEFPHIGVSEDPGDVVAATNGAARSNPSRPYVDIPVNILELGELSRLWQIQGRTIQREARGLRSLPRGDTSLRANASANLRYQYGIRPLVGDLVKLLHFSDVLSRRIGEIERLKSSHGLRRTVKVWDGSANTSLSRNIQSDGLLINGVFQGSTSVGIKVHCRWLPTDVPAIAAPADMRRLARRAVLGLTLDQSTLWEAMPWSWLVDWCSNVGDFFKSQRNIIPAVLNDISVMRHTRTEYSYPGATGSDWIIEPIHILRETKERSNGIVAPTAQIPFLNGVQMGILASLAITRSR